MTVKELIKKLRAFDEDLPIAVEDTTITTQKWNVANVEWLYDGKCTIIID